MIASARIGASRDGKSFVSRRAHYVGSQVGAHRVGRESQPCAESPGRCAGTVDPLCGRPSATRFSSNTAPTTPRNGAVSITQESWSVIQARIALIVLVTATTSTDATNPPSIPPATASAATSRIRRSPGTTVHRLSVMADSTM